MGATSSCECGRRDNLASEHTLGPIAARGAEDLIRSEAAPELGRSTAKSHKLNSTNANDHSPGLNNNASSSNDTSEDGTMSDLGTSSQRMEMTPKRQQDQALEKEPVAHRVGSQRQEITPKRQRLQVLEKELAASRDESRLIQAQLSKEAEERAKAAAREQGALLRLERAKAKAAKQIAEAKGREAAAMENEAKAKAELDRQQALLKESLVSSLTPFSPKSVRRTEAWLSEEQNSDQVENLKAAVAAKEKEAEEAKHALKQHRAWSHRALQKEKEKVDSIVERSQSEKEKAAEQAAELDAMRRELLVLQVQQKRYTDERSQGLAPQANGTRSSDADVTLGDCQQESDTRNKVHSKGLQQAPADPGRQRAATAAAVVRPSGIPVPGAKRGAPAGRGLRGAASRD